MNLDSLRSKHVFLNHERIKND